MDFNKILELIHAITGMDTCYSEDYHKTWHFSTYNTEFTSSIKNQTIAFFKKLRLEHVPISGIRVLKLEDETYIIAKNILTNTIIVGPFKMVSYTDDSDISMHSDTLPVSSAISSIPIINNETMDNYILFINNIDFEHYDDKKYVTQNVSELLSLNSLNTDNIGNDVILDSQSDNELLFHYLLTANKTKYYEIIDSYSSAVITHKQTSSAYLMKHFSYLITTFNAQHKTYSQQAGVPDKIVNNISGYISDQIITASNITDIQKASNSISTLYIDAIEKYSVLKYSKLVNTILDIIHSNIYSKINLNSIAAQMNRDSSYLSQRFKHEMNNTISNYITQMKINEAKFLMKNTDSTITEIAYKLFYSDGASFSKAFKRIVGLSPREYQSSLNT